MGGAREPGSLECRRHAGFLAGLKGGTRIEHRCLHMNEPAETAGVSDADGAPSAGGLKIPEEDRPVVEDSAAGRIRRWNRAYKVAVIWVIGWAALIVEKIVKLDDVMAGLREGFIGGAFVSPFMLILTLPLGWLGSRIGSWEKWRRHRLWFTFGLPTLWVLLGVYGALHERYFPQERFQRITGVAFPRDARVVRFINDDGVGPFYDWGVVYELTCPAEETERIITGMKLDKNNSGGFSSGAGGPAGGWTVDETWSGHGVRDSIFVDLKTDASRTKLWIYCCTI